MRYTVALRSSTSRANISYSLHSDINNLWHVLFPRLFNLTVLIIFCQFVNNPRSRSQPHASSPSSDTTKSLKDETLLMTAVKVEPLLVKASVARSMINDTVIRIGTNLSHSSKLSNATARFLIMKIISPSSQVLFQCCKFVTMASALCHVWSVVKVGYSSLCDAMMVLFAVLQSFTSSNNFPSQVGGLYNFDRVSKSVGNLLQLFRIFILFLFLCCLQLGEAVEISKHKTFPLQISNHDFSQKDTLCDAVIEQIIQVHLLHTDLKQFKKRGLSLLDDFESSFGDESQTIENLTLYEKTEEPLLCKKTKEPLLYMKIEEPLLCGPEDYPKETNMLKEKRNRHANSGTQHVMYNPAHDLDCTKHKTGNHLNISQYLNKNPTGIKNLFYDFMPENLFMESNEETNIFIFSSYNEYDPVRVAYELFKIVLIIYLLLLMIQPFVKSIFRRYFINTSQESADQSSHSSTKVYCKVPERNVLPKSSTFICPSMPSIPQDECSSKIDITVEHVSSMALAYRETAYWILISKSVVHPCALCQGQKITPLINKYQLEGIRSYDISFQKNKEGFLLLFAVLVEKEV